MTCGPNGERRSADAPANALKVSKITTRQEAEEVVSTAGDTAIVATDRAVGFTPARQREIAPRAAAARWK